VQVVVLPATLVDELNTYLNTFARLQYSLIGVRESHAKIDNFQRH